MSGINRRTLLSAAAGAPLLAAAARAQGAAPAGDHRVPPVRIGTLSNGLRILTRTNDSSEIVSIVCLVRAGLPDEREAQAGLAALTAEALVRGSSIRPPKSFQTALLNAGGNLTATPGFDFTEISIVTGREQVEPALKLLAEVVCKPRFAPEDVEAAKELLIRRGAGVRDDFTGGSYEALVRQIYPTSPYGRSMNGSERTLAPLTADDCRRFWDTCYVQNRIYVAVVGDLDSNRAMSLAQKEFATAPFNPQAQTPAPRIDRLTRPRVELLQRTGPAAQVMVGFLAPGATGENYAVHALLDALLGGGKRGRLFANIREKHGIGYTLGSFYQPLLFQSHLVGYVVTPTAVLNERPGEPPSSMPVVDRVKGYLLEEYRRLLTEAPTEQELARAKAYVIGRYALRLERTRDQAKWLAWNAAMRLGHDFDDFFPQSVAAVTREQIQAAARTALNNYGLVVTIPELEP
ncbi:MAG: M16 family metallopeptidase [Armatimonadota bacterium]